jgi:hypothetical protein
LRTGRPIRDVMDDAIVAYRLARAKKTRMGAKP